jgi:hypothetical protein
MAFFGQREHSAIMAGTLRSSSIMAVLILALFPVLLMFRPREAFLALIVGIVLMVQKRSATTHRPVRRDFGNDV